MCVLSKMSLLSLPSETVFTECTIVGSEVHSQDVGRDHFNHCEGLLHSVPVEEPAKSHCSLEASMSLSLVHLQWSSFLPFSCAGPRGDLPLICPV